MRDPLHLADLQRQLDAVVGMMASTWPRRIDNVIVDSSGNYHLPDAYCERERTTDYHLAFLSREGTIAGVKNCERQQYLAND